MSYIGVQILLICQGYRVQPGVVGGHIEMDTRDYWSYICLCNGLDYMYKHGLCGPLTL